MKKSTRKRTRPQTRPQTKAERDEVRRITHSEFARAFNQDAQERNRNRNPDGTVIQPKPQPKTESIVNSYRDIGAILAEALTRRQKLGGAVGAGLMAAASLLPTKSDKPTPPPIRPTQSTQHSDNTQARPKAKLAQPKARVTVKPKDMESESERYPEAKIVRGKAKENLNQQYNRLTKRRKSEREDAISRGATPRERKPLVQPYQDFHGDWKPGPKPDKSKDESIVNSYRDLGYLIAEIGRANPNNSPNNSPSEVPGMFTGKFKQLKNWIQGKLASKKKPKAWSEEERAKQKKTPSKKPTLGDAVRQAQPHKPSSPEQNALDKANDAIDQRDGKKRSPTNRGGIDPSL